jgi:predicted lipoprotein with Yx(FWY)xxD motif
MKGKIFFSILLVFSLVLSACASAAPTATIMPATVAPVIPNTGQSTDTSVATAMAVATAMPMATATEMPMATPMLPATVDVSQNAALGSFLVDSLGMTLYIFTNDTPGTSTCYSTCATYWPPLLTNGMPVAGAGVTDSMLGTTKRTDGSVQVTYNGWPLYFFSKDKAAGDTMGEGVQSTWYVMNPDGTQK